jgi:hypothetical protein
MVDDQHTSSSGLGGRSVTWDPSGESIVIDSPLSISVDPARVWRIFLDGSPDQRLFETWQGIWGLSLQYTPAGDRLLFRVSEDAWVSTRPDGTDPRALPDTCGMLGDIGLDPLLGTLEPCLPASGGLPTTG